MREGDRVLLGHISGAHGIKGEVLIKSHTADPADIDAYGALSSEDGRRTFVVQTLRVTPKGVVARVQGVASRTEAEMLAGTKLYAPRDRLPDPEDGEFYYTDLVGMAALDREGREIGRVVAVQNFGAGDLLEIALTGTRRTELVLFTDDFVPEVDLARRCVVIAEAALPKAEEPGEGETA